MNLERGKGGGEEGGGGGKLKSDTVDTNSYRARDKIITEHVHYNVIQ